MANFISTYSTIELAFLCKKWPSLSKSISECSTSVGQKPLSPPSSQQIQEARLHPSTIILQALSTFAAIQNALNASNEKIKVLLQQRGTIENALAKLISIDEQDKDKKHAHTGDMNRLQNQLLTLNQEKQKLESIKSELQKKFELINIMLPKDSKAWQEHREKYFAELATELLKEHKIVLTTEEKFELNRTSSTPTNTTETRDKLEKLGFKIPDDPSYLTIATYDIIAAAFARTLQKIDPSHIKDIVKTLSVIDAEEKSAKKITSQYKKQYDEIKQDCVKLIAAVEEVALLSEDQLEISTITLQPTPRAPAPTTPEKTQST